MKSTKQLPETFIKTNTHTEYIEIWGLKNILKNKHKKLEQNFVELIIIIKRKNITIYEIELKEKFMKTVKEKNTNTNTHTQLYIDVSKCYQRKMLNYKIIY